MIILHTYYNLADNNPTEFGVNSAFCVYSDLEYILNYYQYSLIISRLFIYHIKELK